MKPIADVCHKMNGRIRVRVPSKKGDHEFFGRCLEEIKKEPELEAVANPLSGSILVVGLGSGDVLLEKIMSFELFEVVERPPSAKVSETVAGQMRRGLSGFDGRLRDVTAGRLDFVSVAVLALLGLGAVQVLRGSGLGPASSLLLNALELVKKGISET
jgi:hypothetical protein